MMRTPPPTRLPVRQRIPGLPVELLQRLRNIPRWAFFLGAMAAIPIATLPVGALARYTTAGPSFCLSCHATGETPDRGTRSLVHASFDQVTCVDCHAKTGQVVFEGYSKGFMAEPDRINQNCVRCHDKMAKTNEQTGFKKDFLDIRITHQSHLERGATCSTCHSNVAHDLAVPQTNRPQMQACSTCHAASDSCAKCHTKGVPTALPPVPVPSGPGETMADGRVYYLRVCSACHGPKGNALVKVDLSRQEVLKKFGDDTIFQAVARGHGEMPAFGQKDGGTLNDEQIHAIVGYLGSEAIGSVPPDGQTLYNRGCVVCHGQSGDKVAGVQHTSPDFWGNHSEGEIFRAISRGLGAMPAMSVAEGGALTNAEITAVIDFLEQKSGFKAKATAGGPDGVLVYERSCAACHGANGRQVPASNLADPAFVGGLGDDGLSGSIAGGKGGMPPLAKSKGGNLSDDEVTAVAQYVKSLAGLATAGPDLKKGKTLFASSCAGCHGSNGAQIASANLGSADFVKSRGDELAKATAEGKGGMPAMGQAKGGKLGDDDVRAVVEYMKSLAGLTVAPVEAGPDVKQGKTLYTSNCAGCHGANGGQIPGANLGSPEYLKAREADLAKATAEGKGGMPAMGKAKGGPLADDQIAAIVAYLKSVGGR